MNEMVDSKANSSEDEVDKATVCNIITTCITYLLYNSNPLLFTLIFTLLFTLIFTLIFTLVFTQLSTLSFPIGL